MKNIRFTFLSLALVFAAAGVDAQERGAGGRGEHQRHESVRPNERNTQPMGRVTQNTNRFPQHADNNKPSQVVKNREVRPQVNSGRDRISNPPNNGHVYNQGNRDNHKVIDNSKNRREPIRISNHNNKYNYSYGKPINKFDHRNYDRFRYNNLDFYGKNGIYYRNWNNNFVRYAPPVGFRINILPKGFITINIGNNPYYFYEGVYYTRNNSYFSVVEPPVGAIVYALPSGYEKVEYYGEQYYEFAGVLYEKIYHRGDRAYQVVGYLS